MAKSKIPVACSLNDAEFRKRREEVLNEIKDGISETAELKNGFVFSFPKEDLWIQRLAEMIILERACCPFINFKLSIEPHQDSIKLFLTGPKGTKEFVSALFV